MKYLILSIILTACLVSGANAVTINVAEHGIVPYQDATFKLNQLLESIKHQKNVTLRFPKGQYNFSRKEAVERYRYVANHDNGLKRLAFNIFDANNLTIDGDGSLFMFHDRIVPFTLDNTQSVTLKNFTIDFIRPFHAELPIVKSDDKARSMIVKVDPKQSPYSFKKGEVLFERFGQWDDVGSNIVFAANTRSPIYNTGSYAVWGTKTKSLGKNLIEFSGFQNNKKPAPVGSVLVVYGSNPTSRLVPGIHVTNSKDLKIENVKVLATGGMALIVERTENIHLDKFVVTSAENRLVATRADATHFIGCKGDIIVENSIMEHMLDDGINVHGAYVNVDRKLQDNQLIASISHFQQMGLTFAEPGDKVAILSRETVLPFYQTTVKRVSVINDKRFIIELDDLPTPS
ncbi:hypothetical protein RS130_09925 [Paraglaciecola aquimarina]|uniref:Right-handed parallel beta-helix repeat-containing protein n=1 Tax=Paraglaciecola aquimarina TaxID=1235557 RepID=A0ABU3SW15_9ALTE|nr:hypothetical protein [Paraglaciecola aquimarina]MDU0354210.1 hypothetical protein [Paraglaciecola aquimarina]